MTTTEDILTDLAKQREASLADGRLVDVKHVDQQVTAHETLARLRAERAEHVAGDRAEAAAGMDAQISYWLRMVDDDVDEPAAPTQGEPGPKLEPAGSAAAATPARKAR